jgi:DNA-binding IclR family transcriptional regulator
LSQRTKEAVNLAVRDGKYVVYIDKMESSATIKVDLVVGKRMPMYCTGLGKVLLAYLPPELVEELFQDEIFEQFTPNTHMSLASLMSELKEIREQGFAWDNEEYVLDLVCIAAPVFGVGGEIAAALSAALPKFRYASDPAKYEEAKDHVVEVAKKLTIALKGSG